MTKCVCLIQTETSKIYSSTAVRQYWNMRKYNGWSDMRTPAGGTHKNKYFVSFVLLCYCCCSSCLSCVVVVLTHTPPPLFALTTNTTHPSTTTTTTSRAATDIRNITCKGTGAAVIINQYSSNERVCVCNGQLAVLRPYLQVGISHLFSCSLHPFAPTPTNRRWSLEAFCFLC